MISRLLKSFSAQSITYGLDIVRTILLVPFFISNWGTELYGSYLSCLSFMALLISLDNGFGLYVSNEYNLLFHKDLLKAKELISSALKVVIVSNILQTCFVFSLIFVQLNFSVFFIEINILYALLILCFYRLLFGSTKGLLVKTLYPIGYFHRSSLIGTSEKIVEILVLIPFVIYSNSFLNAIIFISIFKSVYCVVSLFLIKQWSGNSVSKLRKSGGIKQGFKIYKKSIPLMFNSFFDKSSNDGIVSLISITLGPAIIPLYTTTKTLSNILLKFLNILLHPVIPEFGRLYSKNQNKKIISVFKVIISLSTLAFLPLLFFSYFSEEIYSFWINDKLVFNPILFSTLITSSFIYMYSKIFISYFISINNVRALTTISLLRGVGLLVLTYILIYFFGINGLGWSNLIIDIFLLITTSYLIYKSWDNKSQLFSIKESFIIVVNIIVISIGLYISTNWASWFLTMIIFISMLFINHKSIIDNYNKLSKINFKSAKK